MLKKILLVLLILSPSAVYLYVATQDDKATTSPAKTSQSEKVHNPYQTPEH